MRANILYSASDVEIPTNAFQTLFVFFDSITTGKQFGACQQLLELLLRVSLIMQTPALKAMNRLHCNAEHCPRYDIAFP